jgi:Holliday junction resolvasome RuvABC endonuclease subunit
MAKARLKTFASTQPLQMRQVALGLDPSLTGFAVSAFCREFPELYDIEVYTSPLRGADRLYDILEFLQVFTDRLQEQGCTVYSVAMEGTVRTSPSASSLGELSGAVKVWMLGQSHPNARYPYIIPPSSLKKFVTDNGRASKQDMMVSVEAKYGVELPDDNAADAYALSRIAAGACVTEEEADYLPLLLDESRRTKTG